MKIDERNKAIYEMAKSGMTYAEIGRQVGLTRERVRVIVSALAKLDGEEIVPRKIGRKSKLLKFVHNYYSKNGYAPSQVEIAKALGVSQPVISHMLEVLKLEGVIEYEPYKSRTIRLKGAINEA